MTSRGLVPIVALAILAGCVRRPPAAPAAAPVAVVVESGHSAAAAADLSDEEYLRSRRLAIPVAGVKWERIPDSFSAPRGGGSRRHDALDIMAPRGTPVLSVDDGRIIRLHSSTLGGLTIYATDAEERVIYYYAHLERYRDGLRAGARVAKGDTIGFVGTSGNAPRNIPHLHFQITRMPPDRRWWGGEPINPHPLLAPASAVAAGEP